MAKTKKKQEEEVIEEKVTEETKEVVVETVEDQLAKKDEKIKELQNELLKQHADLDNTKKRLQKERVIERKYAAMGIAKGLITPLDHFDAALNTESVDEAVTTFLAGFKMIKEQLSKALVDEGVSEIDALDEEYNPNFHQAIMTEKVEGKEANIVIQVLQKGYMFKDRVIRPAIVKITE